MSIMESERNTNVQRRAYPPVLFSPRVVLFRLSNEQLTGHGVHHRNINEAGSDTPPMPVRVPRCLSKRQRIGHQQHHGECLQPPIIGRNLTRNNVYKNSNYGERADITISPSSENISLNSDNINTFTSNSTLNSIHDCNPGPDEAIMPPTEDPVPNDEYFCPYCEKTFSTVRGLGVHKRSKHPAQTNEEIDLTRRKYRWLDEDLRRFAYKEAQASASTININQYLYENVKIDPPRTVSAVSSLRRTKKYRDLVIKYRQEASSRIENLEETQNSQVEVGSNDQDQQDCNAECEALNENRNLDIDPVGNQYVDEMTQDAGTGNNGAHHSPLRRNRKPRWTEESIRDYALVEASILEMPSNINNYLFRKVKNDGSRTYSALCNLRRRKKYKDLVQKLKDAINAGEIGNAEINSIIVDENQGEKQSRTREQVSEQDEQPNNLFNIRDTGTDSQAEDIGKKKERESWFRAAKLYLSAQKCDVSGKNHLIMAIDLVSRGEDPSASLEEWFYSQFPELKASRIRKRRQNVVEHMKVSKKRKRRREYAEIQSLWMKNRSKAAKKIIDGDTDKYRHPNLESQVRFWKPIMEQTHDMRLGREPERSEENIARTFEFLLSPVNTTEVKKHRPDAGTAPGPDRLEASNWLRQVPDRVKATVMNVVMAWGHVPRMWRDSRTILIPKKADSMDPSTYRPLSISSIVLRHYHKILAARLARIPLFGEQQRAYIKADGVAENVNVLASILNDAWINRKQLHIGSIDVRKAFDTVKHPSISKCMIERNVPEEFAKYIDDLNAQAHTVIEVDGEYSEPIHPGQGIRQGDPLSGFCFNTVWDEVVKSVPEAIGYVLEGVSVNSMAFADDFLIIASSKEGLQEALDKAVSQMRIHGLSPMPTKCSCISMVPSGWNKKVKLLTTSQFEIDGNPIAQVGIEDIWKHLGVEFSFKGPISPQVQIEEMLSRITKGPLKPQQRMMILRTFLIPRFLHSLVLGKPTHRLLRQLDKLIRKFVRIWIRLPNDTPIAYIHAPIREGGLGIPAFQTKIPELTLRRLDSLANSTFPAAVAASRSQYSQARRRWCTKVKIQNSEWPKRLHNAVDGWELRETRNTNFSYGWVEDPSVNIPSHDWINYIRTRINALPSRMRTTRGPRRQVNDYMCRAGCQRTETTAHIIQNCHRTHGGRMLRHDALTKVVAATLVRKNYDVRREKVYEIMERHRKPDLVITREGRTVILDAQVVSANKGLQSAHELKRNKYLRNSSLMCEVSRLTGTPIPRIEVATLTISWRGVWAKASNDIMRSLGVSRATCIGLTTRVLMGSFLNFRRFNQMTTMASPRNWSRRSENG